MSGQAMPLDGSDAPAMLAPAPAATGARSLRHLRPAVIAFALVPLLIWLPGDAAVSMDARLIAACMWVLCWFPTWHYVALPTARRPPIPFLPLMGIVHAAFYPLQLIIGVDNVLASAVGLDPNTDYQRPIELATLGWLCLLAGAYVFRRRRGPSRLLWINDVTSARLTPLAFVVLYLGLFVEAAAKSGFMPPVIGGAITFVLSVVAASAAWLVMRAARNQLLRAERLRLFGVIGLYLALRLGSGSVAQPLLLLVTIALARWIGGKRSGVGTALIAAVILVFAVSVKGILSDYRDQAWFSSETRTLPEQTGLVVSLLRDRVSHVGVAETVNLGWRAVIGRSAGIDLLGDVVRRTPDPVPHWAGQSYVSLIGIAVPRVLWPDKPEKRLGQDFGHRYGYLNDVDKSTSINFPILVEFYANFGEVGVLIGMFLLGLILRVLERFLNVPGQGQVASALGLVLLVPLINIESDFSLVFGGLLLNVVAFAVLLRYARRIVARRRMFADVGPPAR